jgi:GT2 family glycosyltransferase
MSARLPVIAAIPNYNMGEHLRRLLTQLVNQDYDRIFVLDDASTDDSAEVVKEFGGDVTLVRSPQNRGAAANRNQILDHVDDASLVHFIDADMDLATERTASVARELATRYADQGVGVIGGLVCRVDGSQEPHNYGPVFSLWTSLTSGLPLLIDRLKAKPRLARTALRLGSTVMKRWPNVLQEPVPAEAFWIHEGNMLIHSNALRSVGGYDPLLREHEAQDLSLRLQKKDIKTRFDPSIKVVHHYLDVRGKGRQKKQWEAVFNIIRKHGYVRWLTDA